MEIKGWLDKLYGLNGQRDFRLGSASVDENGKRIFWRNVQKENIGIRKGTEITYLLIAENFDKPYFQYFLSKLNQREIFRCETILDLDDRLTSKECLLKIIEELKRLGVEFYVFDTHSRGYHIHLFFNRDLSNKEKSDVIKHFGADEQLISKKHFVALEFAPHWKSKKIKELIYGI